LNQNVWRTSRDTFETDRAIRAGGAVLDEVRSAERLAAGLATAELSPAAVVRLLSRDGTNDLLPAIPLNRRGRH
jgi:hypothetical protein